MFCTVRNLEKGKKALSGVLKPGRVELPKVDQNSLDSVRACAEDFLSRSKTLNVPHLQRRRMGKPTLDRTVDGFEAAQFGMNHLAHFLFFNILKPVLIRSSTTNFHSRVITVFL